MSSSTHSFRITSASFAKKASSLDDKGTTACVVARKKPADNGLASVATTLPRKPACLNDFIVLMPAGPPEAGTSTALIFVKYHICTISANICEFSMIVMAKNDRWAARVHFCMLTLDLILVSREGSEKVCGRDPALAGVGHFFSH
jgi:hypothetical protein